MTSFAQRHSVCDHCLRPTIATLSFDASEIVVTKSCSNDPPCIAGQQTCSLISSDADYYFKTWISSPGTIPSQGLSGLVIEVTDDCNLRCPTCIAGSEPGAGNTKDLSLIRQMIHSAELCSRKPDMLMISGGEPTIHPAIEEILKLACQSSIDRVMLITNGKRIAEEPAFVQVIAALRDKLEIYLQFDSLDAAVLTNIRGEDLSAIRVGALNHLREYGFSVTLVSVVKKGLNDHLCGDVIRFALQFNNVRGVTFQPIKASGRTDSLNNGTQGVIDLASVRNSIIGSDVGVLEEDILPHPLNPENICIAYLRRSSNSVEAITKELLHGDNGESPLAKSLYFLPKHNTPEYCYDDLFRVSIISFMDKYTFFRELLPYSTIGFITPGGLSIALDSYYMRNREEIEDDHEKK